MNRTALRQDIAWLEEQIARQGSLSVPVLREFGQRASSRWKMEDGTGITQPELDEVQRVLGEMGRSLARRGITGEPRLAELIRTQATKKPRVTSSNANDEYASGDAVSNLFLTMGISGVAGVLPLIGAGLMFETGFAATAAGGAVLSGAIVLSGALLVVAVVAGAAFVYLEAARPTFRDVDTAIDWAFNQVERFTCLRSCGR